MSTTTKRVLLATALFGALGGILPAAKASAGGVIKIAREQDSTTFDPIISQQNPDCWIFPNIFASLVRATPDATKVVPNLAESWTVSQDGKTYTFKLRPGLKFSDGSPIKASDVKFSILRARDTKESAWTSLYTGIADIAAPDDTTAIFTLKAPSAVFLANIAMFAAGILPEAAVTKMGEEAFAQMPVVSGAYSLQEWKHGDKVVLAKNPYFWNAAHVNLDRIEWILIPNDNSRILKLQGGEVDAAIIVPFNRVADLQKDPKLKVHLDPSTREDHMVANFAHKPLDNKDVRQAIYQAIDRKAIVEAVTFGIGEVANSFISKGALFYNADQKDYPHDPEASKALLAKAGVKLPLKLDLLIFAGDSAHEQTAVLMKDQLAKVGIELNVVKQESGQAFDTMTAGNYDLALNYWTNDIIDPDEKTAFTVYGDDVTKSYYTNYKNPEVTKLVDDSRVELDEGKRKQIYYRIQQLAKNDIHWFDLYYSPYRNVSAAYVKNFTQNPLGGWSLEETTLEK